MAFFVQSKTTGEYLTWDGDLIDWSADINKARKFDNVQLPCMLIDEIEEGKDCIICHD